MWYVQYNITWYQAYMFTWGIRNKDRWHLTLFHWIIIFAANNCYMNETRVRYIIYIYCNTVFFLNKKKDKEASKRHGQRVHQMGQSRRWRQVNRSNMWTFCFTRLIKYKLFKKNMWTSLEIMFCYVLDLITSNCKWTNTSLYSKV